MAQQRRKAGPRELLARYGLSPKRAFSQNFLVAPQTVHRIIDAVEPSQEQPVVELGPGLGVLTSALLQRGAHVIAVERDRDMQKVLRGELGEDPALEVIEGDAADIDYASLARRYGEPLAVVGNIPYAATGAILRRLVAHHAHVARVVLMVQREVRDRLRATPGTKDYGALSVFVQAVFDVESLVIVRPGAFHPPPKVDSAVVRLQPRAQPRARQTTAFEHVVRAAFASRRKTLRNALLQAAAGDAARVDAALTTAQIDGRRRGETLRLEEFDALAAAWQPR